MTVNQGGHVVREIHSRNTVDVGEATAAPLIGVDRVRLTQNRVPADATGQNSHSAFVQLAAL
jgi:hypothetical protein